MVKYIRNASTAIKIDFHMIKSVKYFYI